MNLEKEKDLNLISAGGGGAKPSTAGRLMGRAACFATGQEEGSWAGVVAYLAGPTSKRCRPKGSWAGVTRCAARASCSAAHDGLPWHGRAVCYARVDLHGGERE
jgi:hypothetical protein